MGGYTYGPRGGLTLNVHVLVALAAAVALAPSAALATAPSAYDDNVAYFLDLMGLDALPPGDATLHVAGTERTLTNEEGFRLLVERAGDVRLAALAAGASGGGGAYGTGDVWVVQWLGEHGCPIPVILFSSGLQEHTLHPQLAVYHGADGYLKSSNAAPSLIIDWTTKGSTGGVTPGGVAYAGHSDFFCINFGFFSAFHFPYIDGHACDRLDPDCSVEDLPNRVCTNVLSCVPLPVPEPCVHVHNCIRPLLPPIPPT